MSLQLLAFIVLASGATAILVGLMFDSPRLRPIAHGIGVLLRLLATAIR